MEADAERVERLSAALDRRPAVDGATLEGWRFDLSTGWTLRAGLKDGQLGGPYEPPAASRGFSGGAYLRWSDGLVSHAAIDGRTLEELDAALARWRQQAYRDPFAPEIPAPAPLPTVQTFEPRVAALVDGEPDELVAWLLRTRERLQAAGLERLQADSGAGQGWRFVYNSRGLRVAYAETAVLFGLSALELYWRSVSRRGLPAPSFLDELVEDVVATTTSLRPPAEAVIGQRPVLLAPPAAMGLVSKFLIANLAGLSLVTGRSAFTLDDVRQGRTVLREDLSLSVDSTLDLEMAASPISSEGVPGGRATIVERGRLRRPLADLKDAARSGFPPTPVPAGSPGFLLTGVAPPAERAALLAAGEAELEVHALLGLHTQDATSGRYALVAPRGLVWRGGQAVGRAKVGLRGSFFEQLRDSRTRLVAYPWSINPGLLIWPSVEHQA